MQSQGRVLVPLKGCTQHLWAVLYILKPSPGGRSYLSAAHKHVDLRPDGPEGWWCWLPLSLSTTEWKNVHELNTPSLNHDGKTPHYPLLVGTHSFEGIIPLWPPLPDKAIKLSFSTSPKTLSPRFNLVSGYRGHTWLQDLHVHDSNMFIFLPFMCLASILSSVQPQALKRSRGRNFPLPQDKYYFSMFSNETKYSEKKLS